MALALAEDGYAVTAVARRLERLQELAAEAALRGWDIRPAAADMSVELDLVQLFSDHRKSRGRLDVLVNCAGYGQGGKSVAAQDTDLIEKHWAVNLRAPMILGRESFDMLADAGREHGKALFVNVSSIAAKLGPPNMSAYGATKAGMRAFTDSLRAEFAGKGVQVVTFLPSFTASEMSSWLESAGLPLSDLIQPSDLVAAMRYLLATTPNCHIPEIEFACPPATAFIASGALARAGGFGKSASDPD